MRLWTGATSSFASVGDDGVALQPLAVRGVLPCVPQAGERHHLAVGEVEGEGLFDIRIELLPLVKTGGGNDTTPALEWFAICARGGDGLCADVDRGDAFDVREALGKERNQAPSAARPVCARRCRGSGG
jgi:hypothetical protein